jgi:hypothetical protein
MEEENLFKLYVTFGGLDPEQRANSEVFRLPIEAS